MNNYMKTVIAGIKNWVSTQFNKNKANWTVNDPTDPRYVHGRTHWVEETLIELMPEQTVAFRDMGGLKIADSPVTLDLVEGQFYTVNFDGVRYEVSAKSVDGILAIGNPSLAGAEDDSGEPFLYALGINMWATSTETEHTIGVFTISEVYHPFDEKFIPMIPEDRLPENTELIEHLDNINNPHNVTKKQLGLGNVENKSSATIRSELSSANVSNALGYMPVSNTETLIKANVVYSPASYFTTDGAGCITGLTEEGESASEISIPPEIDGTVPKFANKAFSNQTNLIEMHIPDSVTAIQSETFSGCTSLTNIIIPNSVNVIYMSAFKNCTSLANITIPNSVNKINNEVFSGCASLTSIIIPDSVKKIDGRTFDNCTSLTNITIPDSVTSIGSGAFDNCTSLTNITIPDSVTSIGSSTFYNCTSLTSITIPDSVTSIGYNTFYNCTNLTNIIIPDNMTSIGYGAFDNCTSLTSITIPDSVTSIGERAFYNCTNLTNITIPDGVTSIGSSIFCNCTSLTSITIPDSVTSIGERAFYNCMKLTIYYAGSEEQWNAITISDYNTDLINATKVFNYVPEGQ